MPKKFTGTNDKVAAAQERKSKSKQEKDEKEQRLKEQQESLEWNEGAKKKSSKQEHEEEKRAKKLQEKKEKEELLRQEELSMEKERKGKGNLMPVRSVDTYGASNLNDALKLMTLATSEATESDLDRHPERRMKAAFKAFEEREMEILKKELPSLRLSQLKQLLQKKWLKSPENPMNQVNARYNTKASDIKEVAKDLREKELETFKQ